LDRVLAGRPVPRERYEEVVRHYDALGGCSPYNRLTIRQAAALNECLRMSGRAAPVVAGFRNSPPFVGDILASLQERGVKRVLGFVLAAHRCEASWDRYLDEVETARERLGPDAPEFEYPTPWHDHRLFVEAVAERTREAIGRLASPEDRERAHLIFTAHSIPLAMASRSAYVEELNHSARLVVESLGRTGWTQAFQSRSGSPREPWLGPQIGEVLGRLAGGAAVVIPLGFLCDHVEVLYDLDIEAAEIARSAGVSMTRAATVSDHPKFIAMLEAIARAHLTPVSVAAD
ncbi:MAG TPA: ferrochelatase, partial [Candidatus Binataceae bacterium]|nr:ferrochelatase [Candidatus Binataceae bacterium]